MHADKSQVKYCWCQKCTINHFQNYLCVMCHYCVTFIHILSTPRVLPNWFLSNTKSLFDQDQFDVKLVQTSYNNDCETNLFAALFSWGAVSDFLLVIIYLSVWLRFCRCLLQASLEEINLSKMKSRVVQLAINLALDRKASQRELTSIMISDLYGRIITAKDIQTGFDNLLNSIADLVIDSPEAPKVSSQSLI